ncbi:MAG: peptidoglycan DD-metalloendopeptidase family protein [Ignavibacteriales bacterium]|nr:peptidoglycan DD-metalloendopeptidase family protein [Ignavibacteriales bacterium]
MKTILVILLVIIFANPVASQIIKFDGGSSCSNKSHYNLTEKAIDSLDKILRLHLNKTYEDTTEVLFNDPIGDGGTNSFGKTTVNYVDLDCTNKLKDFNCNNITYDGHLGTDVELLNFYDMDEGKPVLCAADGFVIDVHDGEYDRRTSWTNGAVGNSVIVQHQDGSFAYYWHFKKKSIRVENHDVVHSGDTLGMIGSSGFSSGPHLHFEIRNKTGQIVDPYNGSCQPNHALWNFQPEYVSNLPFQLLDFGITTIPLNWAIISEKPPVKTHVTLGDTIYSWLRLRNANTSDTLKWELYFNNVLWTTFQFSPFASYPSSWWYSSWVLPQDSVFFGNWKILIFRNDSPIAENSFIYNNKNNQLPVVLEKVIEVDKEFIVSEFSAIDTDGSIFWYKINQDPGHGTIEQFGGRHRKFLYRPQPDFTGVDTLKLYAIDDENKAGKIGNILFLVKKHVSVDNPLNHHLSFKLMQNFPNPFNPITTIIYQVPEPAHVTLIIYSILGEEISTLFDDYKSAGRYEIKFDSNNLPDGKRTLSSGIYLYKLRSGNFCDIKKLIILK